MKRLSRILILPFCLLAALFSVADTSRLYMPEQMSSSLITCICQDRYGYIWVGTEYGLDKFDGYRFTPYLHNAQDTTSISDNEISSLFIDDEGQLWVGCAKGLVRYDYERDAFHRYHFPDDREPRVNAMQQNAEGTMLIGTAGYGLYSIRRGTTHIDYESRFNRRSQDMFYSSMHLDREQNLWRSSHVETLTKFSLKNGQPTALRDYQSTCGQPMCFLDYGQDRLLIFCMYGILSYSYSTGEVTPTDFDLSVLAPDVSIKNACLGKSGNIYVATSGNGLMVIPKGERTMRRVANGNPRIDLASANIPAAMTDKDHNLWIACYNKGLLVLNQNKEPFQHWDLSDQHYRTGGGVASIAAADGDGSVWCSVQNSGVFGFDANGRIIAHPSAPVGTKLIYRDHDGQYWLCTENVLYRYVPHTGQATAVQTFNGRGLNCLTDDGQGRIYISDFGMGLRIYDTRSHSTEHISMHQTERKGGYLCNDWIKSLQFDSHGELWIGTTNGLSVMNPADYSFNHRGWNVLLEGKQCFATCEAPDGNMLIGTDSGLFIYDRRSNKVAQATGTEVLNNKLISAMTPDGQGNVWISTSHGIWQYNYRQHKIMGHVNGNGLNTKEYVIGAMLRQTDGRIYFGTADGITTFRPGDVGSIQPKMGAVHLTRFIVNGHSQNPMQTHFELSYRDNTFTMEFSLLDFQYTESTAFQYRINDNGEWRQTNEGENQLTLNQLQPGSYTIEVRGIRNGVYSDPPLRLTVRVAQPWYKSWWAYLAYATIIGGFLFLILFNFERQRRRDLEETKMQFLINATHDIRSPLTLIMGPLEKLKKRLTDAENLSELETIDKNAKRLLLLVNQILDERKIDKKQMRLHCTETDLATFVKGIFSLYEYSATQRNIDYQLEVIDQPGKVWIDRINFDKVVSNLLSNAFKYTFDGGQIKVTVKREDDHAVIQVTDSGLGFEDDNTERFFERFYQGKNSGGLHIDGTGIGLNLCRALTQMHGGTISAANRKDGQKGAILTVKLRYGNSHLKPEEIEQEESAVSTQKTQTVKQQASRHFRVLVVDDDSGIRDYISHELGDWYKFEQAANGREALKMLFTKQYDVVVSDVMMPEMDGITLLRSIKSNPNISDVPVILLTSKSEVSFRLEGLKKGADAFLAKPFSMEELHILIDNLVDNVRRLRGKFTGKQNQSERIEQVKVKGNNDALMDKIMKSINSNLSNPDYDVETLTKDVGISRAQLHRKMKEITGISTSEFVRNLRLEQAARLIREHKINITQVAYSVGFNNQTHFSTVFKKHFGMTPTEYSEGGEDTPQETTE